MNREEKIKLARGNATEYGVEKVTYLNTDSPLAGKSILFLGSSVTLGACSMNESMADFIGKIDCCKITKEAVNGTTLSTVEKDNYIERLLSIDTNNKYDMVVVQLSTNDAYNKIALGKVTTSMNANEFDTKTVLGAIEYIIAYIKSKWDCPIVFYTGTKYDSEHYAKMVDELLGIRDKWCIAVADLWNDNEMSYVSSEEYRLYMYDKIHPTRAGYLMWWTPKIEGVMYDAMINTLL